LREAAQQAFPESEYQVPIASYVGELDQLMKLDEDVPGGKPARTTSDGQDAITLLCRFEDYLESILVGKLAKRAGG
jgi:hypothetical protein